MPSARDRLRTRGVRLREAGRRLRRIGSMTRRDLGTDDLAVVTHRRSGNDAAVVFVHGFGASEKTWGEIPQLLADEPALSGWDLHSVGYDTSFAPDLRGVWSADPDLAVLATFLRTRARLPPLGGYDAVAFVAHSMGGLILQRALVDDPTLVGRTSHLVLFGTPSRGLKILRWGAFYKTQLRDCSDDSAFIADLRRRWDEQFGDDRPFRLWTVAGDRDVFIPADSSLGPLPPDTHVVIPGNHLEICFAGSSDDMGVQVLVDALVGEAAPGGPWNSARVAVERREFHRAVELLSPHAGELDEAHLVTLALALDETGERERAVELLRAHAPGTDARGTLAGRLKRAWMAEGRRTDAEEALAIYLDAYEEAVAAGDHDQAAYHGINLAFLELAYRSDLGAAARWAGDALRHCDESPPDHWRRATEGEAHLYLGGRVAALDAYRAAVAVDPSPREVASMHAQASWVAGLLDDDVLQEDLEWIFRPEAESVRSADPGDALE